MSIRQLIKEEAEIFKSEKIKNIIKEWAKGWKQHPFKMIGITIFWIIITSILTLTLITVHNDMIYCQVQKMTLENKVVMQYEIPLMDYMENPEQTEENYGNLQTAITCRERPIQMLRDRRELTNKFNEYQKNKQTTVKKTEKVNITANLTLP